VQLTDLNERGKKADAEHPEGDSAVFKRGAIISVHGINTIGEWQDDLSLWVQEAGYFTARVGYEKIFLKAPLPSQRNEVVERIGKAHERFRERGVPVSVIAHSYGSCALGYFLLRNPAAQLRGVVLYGSILRRKFPWSMCVHTCPKQH
jgi:alpha-beta hydrolase superfamily lysophospholipase